MVPYLRAIIDFYRIKRREKLAWTHVCARKTSEKFDKQSMSANLPAVFPINDPRCEFISAAGIICEIYPWLRILESTGVTGLFRRRAFRIYPTCRPITLSFSVNDTANRSILMSRGGEHAAHIYSSPSSRPLRGGHYSNDMEPNARGKCRRRQHLKLSHPMRSFPSGLTIHPSSRLVYDNVTFVERSREHRNLKAWHERLHVPETKRYWKAIFFFFRESYLLEKIFLSSHSPFYAS